MSTKSHWEQVYTTKSDQQVSWFQPTPARSLALIDQLKLSRDEPIMDVGAGNSRLVDNLLKRGFRELSVLDISAAALESTRKRLGQQAEAVNWIVADVTEFQPAPGFALWHDRAVFHFLTQPTQREAYRAALTRALKPGGFAIIAAFSPEGPKQCSGLDIVQYDVNRIEQALGHNFELIEAQSESHQTPFGTQQQFNYFLLQSTTNSD